MPTNTLPQPELELEVLASITSLERLAEVRSGGVTTDTFTDYPHIFEFVQDYIREYGKDVPSKALLEQKFGFALPEAPADVDYRVRLLVEREVSRKAHLVLEKGIDLLVHQEKPSDAVNYLLMELSKLRRHKRVTRNTTDKNALSRLDSYLEKAEILAKGGNIGLHTGLEFFDKEQLGLVPGNFLGVFGNTGIGKSWLIQYIACSMYIQGARVLFVSPEMSVPEVEARWDTLVGALHGVQLSNMGLMRGTDVNIQRYREFLESVANRADWETCSASDTGMAFTLGGIEDMVMQFKPTVLALDGIPLVGVDNRSSKGEMWQRIADVSYGLKNMSELYGMVVLASNQAVRDGETKEDLALKDSAYGYAFVQACDRVLSISKPRDGNPEKERSIRVVKTRAGKKSETSFRVAWDVDAGIIG